MVVAQTHTPPSSLDHQHSDGGIRKRVCKACDRCRLKKSKCDGSSPCSRCKADNAICVFGERKKSHDKVYPKGYVEMLEQQQGQLITGLQELYRRTINGQGWPGSALNESNNGNPLIHDILDRLGALKQDGHSESEHFEEDTGAIQQRLIANGAGFMQRTESLDGSESPKSATFDHIPRRPHSIATAFPPNAHLPPTPPDNNSFAFDVNQNVGAFNVPRYNQPTSTSMALNPSMLQRQWIIGDEFATSTPEMNTSLNPQSDPSTLSPQYLASPMAMGSMSMMDWNDEEAFQTYFNATPA